MSTHDQVRARYGAIADGTSTVNTGCCPPSAAAVPASAAASGCCGAAAGTNDATGSRALGYGDELSALPDGADLGLGCGNPAAFAAMRAGETVLDLGSGAGIDCFLAARAVGPTGRVIGVDMTPAMLTKARANAVKVAATNVEFRLGEIEHLPLSDASIDVVISNCVINLSPDKAAVFREIARVLKPGGRIAISDVVAIAELPAAMRNDSSMLCGCIGGALSVEEIHLLLRAAGLTQISIDVDRASREFIKDWAPSSGAENLVASARIQAVKAAACAPGAGCC